MEHLVSQKVFYLSTDFNFTVVEEIRRELLTASQQSLEIAARLSKRLEPPEAPTTTIELSQTSHEILFNSRTCLLQEMSMKSIVSEQRQKVSTTNMDGN